MRKINIECTTCGKITQKNKAEIDRQKRKGKINFYCNLKCAGKSQNNIRHLKKFEDNFIKSKYIRQSDKYSDFRWYIKNCKKNSKKRNHEFNIDCEYLKELWEQQNGKCPFTNQKLLLRTHKYHGDKNPYQASLDRIDNNIGYMKGNIRFVSLIYNYAKNNFTDNDVAKFCQNFLNNRDNYES